MAYTLAPVCVPEDSLKWTVWLERQWLPPESNRLIHRIVNPKERASVCHGGPTSVTEGPASIQVQSAPAAGKPLGRDANKLSTPSEVVP